MPDILERLTPEYVASHPLVLLEAADTIKALRAEIERDNRWIRILENMLATQAEELNERKSSEG